MTGDRYLLQLIVQPTTRRPKRSRPPDEFPSSASVEFVSVTIGKNGRVTKKRVVEKNKFNSHLVLETSRLFPPPIFNANGPFPLPDIDSPQDTTDRSVEPKAGAVSRAASVSAVTFCCVTS